MRDNRYPRPCERLAHILEHTELAGTEDELKVVLQVPSEVRLSQVDQDVKIFYKFFRARK